MSRVYGVRDVCQRCGSVGVTNCDTQNSTLDGHDCDGVLREIALRQEYPRYYTVKDKVGEILTCLIVMPFIGLIISWCLLGVGMAAAIALSIVGLGEYVEFCAGAIAAFVGFS